MLGENIAPFLMYNKEEEVRGKWMCFFQRPIVAIIH